LSEAEILVEAQRIADATTALYGVPPVFVVLVDSVSTGGTGEYEPLTRTVRLKRATVLGGPTWRGLVAHELGHVVSLHDVDGLCTDVATAERAELDANARGVEILIHVVGLSVQEAIDYFVQSFLRIKKRLEESTSSSLPASPTPTWRCAICSPDSRRRDRRMTSAPSAVGERAAGRSTKAVRPSALGIAGPDAGAVLDRYLSLRDLADYCSLSVRTLRDYISAPVRPLPCYRIAGKILVRRSEFDAWMAAHRQASPPVNVAAIVDDMLGPRRSAPASDRGAARAASRP